MTSTDESTRAFWALGDYHAISLLIADLGPALVVAAGVRPGLRVLDVGAGSGNATLPAARAGAAVTAVDPTPELMAIGERAAAGEGLSIDWVTGVAEDLPFPTHAFDVVLSSVGAMFARDQAATAAELRRVCRPGGTVAMANWTPDGAAGRFFAVLGRHGAPTTDPPPTAWGDPDSVRALLAQGCAAVRTTERECAVRFTGTAAELAAHYRRDFAPVIATAAALDDDTALLDDLAALLAGADRGPAGGPPRYVYEYLEVVATTGA
ncbi:class I SAM-dependent methyltransferase [Pseudonocardia lacus]|uniref:class I SAM-dependent methyltransferase n=1 Tax=Pseudonocardia lacus TaxID=2835865 RepID=UPI001BDD9BA7|nr:class I SAM-dependent methyltransferase [Pseudonocardia lacus]